MKKFLKDIYKCKCGKDARVVSIFTKNKKVKYRCTYCDEEYVFNMKEKCLE